MADAKIEIKVGAVSFSGEGAEGWLSQQLDKVLQKVPDLVKASGATSCEGGSSTSGSAGKAAAHGSGGEQKVTLAAFLKDKKATSNQVKKFIATAAWLEVQQGKNRLVTADVTKALNDHNQGRLGNAAQCLIQASKKGAVARDGKKEFYVTDEGKAELNQ